MMKIIGIAGGSGAGKSAVSYALVDANPELFDVLNLDDYQKLKTDKDLPILHGKINWDHPDIIRWADLIHDIEQLKAGQPVTIQVWSHRSNPSYHKHGQMIARTIQPKPLLIIEGYLALFNDKVNKYYDRKYFLNADEETRNARRNKNQIIRDDEYAEKILKPMYDRYVEPTKRAADKIIDVSDMTADAAALLIQRDISN